MQGVKAPIENRIENSMRSGKHILVQHVVIRAGRANRVYRSLFSCPLIPILGRQHSQQL